MSHQTGIKANEKLKGYFAKCKEGGIRLLKVSIEEEQLTYSSHKECIASWDKDFDDCVKPLIEDDQPCFMFYRLDVKDALGYQWILISWSPDTAPVRQKMLYASTKATLKQEFGTSQIKEELHGTILDDITWEGYIKHKRAMTAPAPLSMKEEELQEIKRTEINTEYGVDSKQQTLGGVLFPLTESAKQAIVEMGKGHYDYVQFKINITEEKIDLVSSENLKLDNLPSKVPTDGGRYHLFKFKHTHEGDYTESIIFIYSMPGYNCPIKERMLYSSCKNPFTDTIASMGLDIVKKIEIDSGRELTEQFLYEELHPTKCLHRMKFDKPKGPPGRGPKRMTKSQPQQ